MPPHLADAYASVIITDRPARDRSRYAALAVCDAALRLQVGRQARIWRELSKRRDRIAPLAANPPKPTPALPAARRRNKRPTPDRRLSID